MFPVELPRRLIKMFSFVGETVLDPFMGSGTTALAASQLGRSSVGYELNREFEEIQQDKLNGVANLSFEVDSSRPNSEAISRLPYKFIDPVQIDKKIDPRKKTFGSKIKRAAVTQE